MFFKMVFLIISHISQENIPVLPIFLTKLQTFRPATIFKRDSNTGASSCEISETIKNTYFKEHLRTTAF